MDIDLNYIGASDLETALLERSRIDEAIRAVATREGLVIRRVTHEHAAITFFLRYESVFGQGGDLKVDMNFMFRVPLWPVIRLNSRRIGPYEAKDFPVIDILNVFGDNPLWNGRPRMSVTLKPGDRITKRLKSDIIGPN